MSDKNLELNSKYKAENFYCELYAAKNHIINRIKIDVRSIHNLRGMLILQRKGMKSL